MLCSNCRHKERPLRDVVCASCGKLFKTNGTRTMYCPDCRKERRAKASNDFRSRSRHGNSRKIGSQDYCKRCGAKYTVEGGLQMYCRECGEMINKERQQAAAIRRYNEKKDELNPKRNENRRETPEERKLNTRSAEEPASVAKNIMKKSSGSFEVKCYRHSRSYYLGTYDTLEAAISARDRFLNAPGDADLVTVSAGIRAENSGRKQQSYLRLLRDKEGKNDG